jgi:hypothetical protein
VAGTLFKLSLAVRLNGRKSKIIFNILIFYFIGVLVVSGQKKNGSRIVMQGRQFQNSGEKIRISSMSLNSQPSKLSTLQIPSYHLSEISLFLIAMQSYFTWTLWILSLGKFGNYQWSLVDT